MAPILLLTETTPVLFDLRENADLDSSQPERLLLRLHPPTTAPDIDEPARVLLLKDREPLEVDHPPPRRY